MDLNYMMDFDDLDDLDILGDLESLEYLDRMSENSSSGTSSNQGWTTGSPGSGGTSPGSGGTSPGWEPGSTVSSVSRPSQSPDMLPLTDDENTVSDPASGLENWYSDPSGLESDATVVATDEDDASNDATISPVLTLRPPVTLNSSAATTSHQQQPASSEAGDVELTAGCSSIRHSEGPEPPSKVRRVESECDGETCPICLDTWANSGPHRIVSLKCGHLFGKSCVERWLKNKPARERCCPTCKTRAALRDLRHIFARRLVAADTSEITVLQSKVEELEAAKNRVELELQKTIISHRACITQLEGLRSTLMKPRIGSTDTAPPPRRHWRFALEKNLEMSREGGCRVLTYNCRTYELYVSQRSANPIFPGYGIRTVSCVDYAPGQFVHMHSKSIRDMTYSTQRDLLLSVGLDNTARVVERGALTTTIQAGFPLWSCSWDYLRTNEFYVGGVGGQTLRYDIRNPRTHLQRLIAESDLSPVASLASTEHGLLSCQLNSCWLWGGGGAVGPRPLPLDGPFMALSYDEESHRALVACRPPADGRRARLALCRLRTLTNTAETVVEHEQTFPGSARSTLLSRPAWVRGGPDARWAAAHSESDATLYLHGVDGARTLALPAADPARDVCAVQLHAHLLLAALSHHRLRLYRAVATVAS